MRIRERILLGFVVLGVVIGFAGYTSFSLSRRALKEMIGHQSVELAHTAMNHIQDTIQHRLHDVRRHTLAVADHERLVQSNHAFERMDDVNEVIQRREADWQTDTSSEWIQRITDSELSQYLRDHLECREYFLSTYGYRVFGECFITNKYGVNIAQTGKTSDYYQADEIWWQQAKANKTYVGQIQYDKSAGLYEVDLAVGLADCEGRFAGVVKAVLNIQQFIEAMDTIKARSDYTTTRLRLVFNNVVIYDTRDQTLLTGALEPSLLYAVSRKQERSGYMEAVNASGADILAAFCRVYPPDRLDALDVMMLIDHEKDEILAPIAKLELKLFCVTVCLFLIASVCAWLFAVNISRPLVALKQMALDIGRGNLDVRSHVKASGEIGQLAATFDRMREDLKTTLNRLENEIAVRQKAEHALETNNRELLATLRRVNHAKKQLEDFAHIAAHDIKSPVRAIGTLADWIMSNQECHVKTDARMYLEQLKGKAKHLNDLADSLIQYSEITADRKNETVDCHRLILDLLGTLSIPASVTVSVEGQLPTVSYAPGQLKVLFGCLIDNAVRFSDKTNGTVTIACRETDNGWLFSVGDNGPGIEDRYHDKIFQMFQRLDSDDDRLGAGLALAKKIVEIHDGDIWVESSPGQGSTFFFTILYEDESAPLMSTSV